MCFLVKQVVCDRRPDLSGCLVIAIAFVGIIFRLVSAVVDHSKGGAEINCNAIKLISNP